MMGEKDLQPFPESDPREFGYHVSMATVGVLDVILPGLGYGAQQIAQKAIANPLHKRQAEWFNSLRIALEDLRQQFDEITHEDLAANEDFVTAVLEVTPLAIKTHREGKRKIYENVVLNAAAGITLDDALKGKFLTYLDQFSEGHIAALRILADPMSYESIRKGFEGFHSGPKIAVLAPEFEGQGINGDVRDVILSDLAQERLSDGNLNTMMTQHGAQSPSITPLGKAFLNFIKSPLE